MIRTLVIDDEPDSREVLCNLLADLCPQVLISGMAGNVATGIKAIKEIDPELVFLDIGLPDGSGFDLLERIPHINFQIILTTGYNEFALKAFEYGTIDYLLKPLNPGHLVRAVNKVTSSAGSDIHQQLDIYHQYRQFHKVEKIGLHTNDGIEFVYIDNIIRCQAEGNYTLFVMKDNSRVFATKPLKYFDKLLSELDFFRTHQSHLINLHYLKKFVKEDGGFVVMEDGSIVEIARRRKKAFLNRIENQCL